MNTLVTGDMLEKRLGVSRAQGPGHLVACAHPTVFKAITTRRAVPAAQLDGTLWQQACDDRQRAAVRIIDKMEMICHLYIPHGLHHRSGRLRSATQEVAGELFHHRPCEQDHHPPAGGALVRNGERGRHLVGDRASLRRAGQSVRSEGLRQGITWQRWAPIWCWRGQRNDGLPYGLAAYELGRTGRDGRVRVDLKEDYLTLHLQDHRSEDGQEKGWNTPSKKVEPYSEARSC